MGDSVTENEVDGADDEDDEDTDQDGDIVDQDGDGDLVLGVDGETPCRRTAPPARERRWTMPERTRELSECQVRSALKHRDRGDVGNVGFLMCNWGKRPADKQTRDAIDEQLKKNPCGIIGLAECQAKTEELLREKPTDAPAVAGAATDATQATALDEFRKRKRVQYITVRPNEADTVLIGARASVAESIELLHWNRIYHGPYKPKKKKGRKSSEKTGLAYSRLLIAKITCHKSVGYMGRDLNVAVVHLHNKVGNREKHFRRSNQGRRCGASLGRLGWRA